MISSYPFSIQLFRIFGLVTALLLISCQQKTDKKVEIKHQAHPNVIVIVADDQGYGDIGVHGNTIIKTPHLDQFANESLELTNFHVGTTCTPTRAGIMTGRNANRNNAWHTIAGCSILLEDEETIAQVFKQNGYQTAMFGKWHLGDNKPFRPQDRGFDNALYNGGGGVGQTPDYWGNDYFDDIDNADEKPFFMYLATNAAHAPFNVPKAYADIYKDAVLNEGQKRFYGMITHEKRTCRKYYHYIHHR